MSLETRALMVEVATVLFFKQGVDKTSISQITKSAGASKSLFYHYFESKDTLLKEIIRKGTEDIMAIHKEMTTGPKMTEEDMVSLSREIAIEMKKRQDIIRIIHQELLANTFDQGTMFTQLDYFFEYAKERASAYFPDADRDHMKFVIEFIFFGCIVYHQYMIYEEFMSKKFNYDKDEMWEVFLELYQENYLTQLAERLI